MYAAKAGADALGFVFFAPSPRNIGIEAARTIVLALPPFVTTVGLFVDPEPAFVERVLAQVPLDLLQFHGDETAQACERFDVPYIKALRMRPEVNLLEFVKPFHRARGLLLDAYVSGTYGGTGTAFNWQLIPPDLPTPIVLSGGLDPTNVGMAIRQVRPWAVDVSSGVEASKGIKDTRLIQTFIAEVRNADA
jgi:phosphoribosylanthranilate isomerase